MKTRSIPGFLVPVWLAASVVHADDKATCLDAASKAQRLQDAHKLVEARERLRVCARAQCPAVVQTDCANWLAEVEKTLPTVVFVATTRAGAALVDVKVSIDGLPLAPKLDGQALPVNAGLHTFHFESASDGSSDQQVLVNEGERNRAVAVVLAAAAPAQTPPSNGSAQETGGRSRASNWVGWVLGGAGVLGLGVGTVFGVVTLGDKRSAHCDDNNVCDPGTVGEIKNASLVSDIGWLAGGTLLAAGVAVVLFVPSGSHGAAAGIGVAPVFTAGGGEIVTGGRW
jgi:hypothetical protein